MAAFQTSKIICTRALHQCAAIGAETVVFNPEAIVSKYGSRLTSAKACRIITEQKDSTEAFRFFDWIRDQRGYKHNGSVYGALIHSLCLSKRFDLLEKVLMDLRNEKFGLRAPTFTFILKSLGQEGKIQESLQLFHRMAEFRCEPSLSTYRCILCMLVEAGSLDEVLTIFQEMLDANVVPDNFTLGMLTNFFCKRGRLDEALMFAETLPKSVDSLTLNGLVRSLCKEARPHDAIRLIESAKGINIHPDTVTYEKLIHSLCRIGNVDDAIAILDKVSKGSSAPSISTFNIVLCHLCKFVRVDEAYQLFKRLPMEPDSVSFKVIVNGFCKKRMVDEAQKLVIEMANRGFIPTLEMYSWIAKRLISLGRVEEACHLLHSLEGKGLVLDKSFLNGFIEAMCRAGHTKAAQQLLDQRSAKGFSADKFTHAAIISGFCKEKQFLEGVRYTMNNVLMSGCIVDMEEWSPLFTGLYEEGHLNEAMKLYDALLEQQFVINKCTFTIILRGLSKAGRILDLKRVMSDMQKNDISIDRQTYESLIESKCHSNLKAAELFKTLIGSNILLSKEKYTNLIDDLLMSGEAESAITVFHEMRRVGCLPNMSTYSILIDGLCNLDNLSEARGVLRRMKEDGCAGETAMYTLLMQKYSELGQHDEAELLYREMRDGGILPDAAIYHVLMEGFARANRVDELLPLLDEMRVCGCPPSESTLSSLLKTLGSRHIKRFEKHIKELFGIILTSKVPKSKEVGEGGQTFSLPFLDSFTGQGKSAHKTP